MFIFTAKLTKKKLITAIVLAGLLLAAIILLLATAKGQAAEETAGVKGLKTNDDRVAFLTSLGWDVVPDPVDEQEVLIPAEWDSVLDEYNAMQQMQGLGLEKVKNKQVTRYVYLVRNHPSGTEHVYICLLVYKNKLVAADIQSHALDGFMEPLLIE